MALTRKLARGGSSESAPISIANKEAAYALTGVAAGTVYKTDDTGQVMEYRGKRDALSDVIYVDSDYIFSDSPVGDNPSTDVRGYYYRTGTINEKPAFTRSDGAVIEWWTEWGISPYTNAQSNTGVYSMEDVADPLLVVGGWSANAVTNSPQTVALGDSPELHPNNWKMDGVIGVYDNDEKILLTNLPDGQQVEITGEGGRIEQLPPSPLPDIKRGFIISDAGNPRSSVSDGGSSVSGAFFWHETDSQFVRDDDGGYYAAYVVHDGSRWQIGYQMGYFFQSDLCASTVHPADATGWTAYDAGGGIGQGTIADDGLVKTRACEVYNSPQYKSSGNTLWFTIKNTVYLTVNDAASSGGYDVNGVTVANGAVQGIGWVQVGERVTTTKSTILYKLSKVDEDTTFTFGATVIDMVTVGYDFTLPDVLPNGGTVEIKNA